MQSIWEILVPITALLAFFGYLSVLSVSRTRRRVAEVQARNPDLESTLAALERRVAQLEANKTI